MVYFIARGGQIYKLEKLYLIYFFRDEGYQFQVDSDASAFSSHGWFLICLLGFVHELEFKLECSIETDRNIEKLLQIITLDS